MESLSVKYRPQSFDTLCGQNSIKKILMRQLETKQFNNCYLFCGPSGCGKTTVARIFAHKINEYTDSNGNLCSSEPIEIDGASNNGVDNVKAIIQSANVRSLDGKYKVYIIDETHALTSQAWQAFLKCIEEPPAYTIFIFCTTDPQKLPNTILNRMMRFNFTRLTTETIRNNLLNICAMEHLTNYTEACDYIARMANGGMRDAISLLDKCAQYSTDLSMTNVLEAIGHFSYDILFNLVNALVDGQEAAVLKLVADIYQEGTDLKLFVNQLLHFCLDVNKYAIFKSIEMTSLPNTLEEQLKYSVGFENATGYYMYVINKLIECKSLIKDDTDIKTTIEVCLLNICKLL